MTITVNSGRRGIWFLEMPHYAIKMSSIQQRISRHVKETGKYGLYTETKISRNYLWRYPDVGLTRKKIIVKLATYMFWKLKWNYVQTIKEGIGEQDGRIGVDTELTSHMDNKIHSCLQSSCLWEQNPKTGREDLFELNVKKGPQGDERRWGGWGRQRCGSN